MVAVETHSSNKPYSNQGSRIVVTRKLYGSFCEGRTVVTKKVYDSSREVVRWMWGGRTVDVEGSYSSRKAIARSATRRMVQWRRNLVC